MRVLIISWEYAPNMIGGLGKHVMELAPALVSQGCQVHVLTPRLNGGPSREIAESGIAIYRPDVPLMDRDFIAFNQYVNLLLQEAALKLADEIGGFDLIHIHDWLTAPAGIAVKHAWKIPLVATIHATERGRGQGRLLSTQSEQINAIEWQLTYEAWRVIACSDFMADQVHSYFSTPPDKIDVVPNGVCIQPSPFTSEADRLAYRRAFAEDAQPLAFYVGRIVYEKGLHILLDSWPSVLRIYPRARLLIAGSGPFLADLRQQASALGISDNVTFGGFITDDERDKLYHIASAAVFPSLYEPFGMVALEAMAARCPVVVSATGGLTEVVKPHETGITVQPGNPQSLTWGLLHTFQNPPWTQARVENAYADARDNFSWEKIARETMAVYNHVKAEWDTNSWGK
ncbi:glycosyltransferase family 4 protein [Chloroflexia bacterium SDU3-3]|nr:glycosyltransferase family 4 protein [Chloroflexia bacterium SDU3-3]